MKEHFFVVYFKQGLRATKNPSVTEFLSYGTNKHGLCFLRSYPAIKFAYKPKLQCDIRVNLRHRFITIDWDFNVNRCQISPNSKPTAK